MAKRPTDQDLLELLVPAPLSSPADQERHAIARTAFLLALLHDREAELDALWGAWADRMRRSKTAAFTRPPKLLEKRIQAEASLFLRGLGLPAWPWLALGLVRFFLLVHARAHRQQIPRPIVTRLPADALRGIYGGDGRRSPKGGGMPLAGWAKWYYRHRVLGHSVRRLSRENHEAENHPRPLEGNSNDPGCDCRKVIKHALAEVARLLDTNDPPPLVPLGK